VIPPSRGISYWLREALEHDPGEPCPPLRGEISADVAILGGGYTGLWTAWFLVQRNPGIDVALLERDVCGSGASGRNGGFVGGWWDDAADLVARYGEEGALAACRAAAESVTAIGDWCREHHVDVWYRRVPYLEVASSAAQEGAWRADAEACRRIGEPDGYREITEKEVRSVCATPVLRGGAVMDGATVQPARLARGLRRVLLERGVRVFERTPATRFTEGSAVLVETPEGSVRAGRVVLALNAWSARWPGLRRAIVVRGSYVLATEPVPDRLEALGWSGGECICDLRTGLHYFRTTPDGRVVFGGVGRARGSRIGAGYDHDSVSLGWVHDGFRRLFPSLADVRIEEGWGGAVDISGLGHPVFGTLAPGTVHYAVGYTGNGVGPSYLAGRVLAALATDANDPITTLPMVNREPVRFPPQPFRALGTAMVQAAILRRDRLQDVGRRPGPVTRLLSTVPRRLGYGVGPSPR
jgi:glycine/D-amino acid oxidase-like deaminating enzyme